MGTRSLTFVHDESGEPIICIYQQYDGYFDGVGSEILSFLKGSQIVNGIGMGDGVVQFNGAGDLACRLITQFKGGDPNHAGGVYIEPTDCKDGDVGTEFAYHIYCTVGQEPRLVATDLYAQFTVDAPVSEFVWPQRDDDGNYIPAYDPNAPLTDDQRRALFATWGNVFGGDSQEARILFSRMVLGYGDRIPVSWSRTKPGALTAGEASKVLDALSMLEAAL